MIDVKSQKSDLEIVAMFILQILKDPCTSPLKQSHKTFPVTQ